MYKLKLPILAIALVLFTLVSCVPPPAEAPFAPEMNAEISANPSTGEPTGGETPDTPEPPAPSVLPSPELPPSARIQFAGDILLHSGPVKTAKTGENTYDFRPFFEEIAPYIDGDLAICNIETPIDVKGGNKDLTSYPMFNAPREILSALRGAGFDTAINANNHSFDKGFDGLVATRANLEAAGFKFTGTYETREQRDTYLILDVNGIKVGLIAYTDALNGLDTYIPESKRAFAIRKFSSASTKDVPRMLEDMDSCRDAGAELIILALHWGAEYKDDPNDTQKEIARQLCAGGADILMGNHSHCVQPIVWLPGREEDHESLCVYSMGNFFADQIGLNPPVPKTQYSMIMTAVITKDADGDAFVESAEYLPTYTYRYPNKDGYSIVPAANYAASESLVSQTDRNNCQKAYDHVAKIVGDAVEVSALK